MTIAIKDSPANDLIFTPSPFAFAVRQSGALEMIALKLKIRPHDKNHTVRR
jgi:hypothetical protein